MKILKTFNNILIVRTDRMGDLVLTTPAIKALRHAYPRARITVLVNPINTDLIKGNPYIDEVLVDGGIDNLQNIWGLFSLIQQLKLKKFDLAVIFHTKQRYNLACFLAGIPFRLGYKNKKLGFLLNMPLKDTRNLGQCHEAQYCLDLLKRIGCQHKELDLFVPVSPSAEEWVGELMIKENFKANEFLVIHAGASDATKCWPAALFAVLIDAFIEKYHLKVVLIGAKETMTISQAILNQSHFKESLIDLTGKTSIAQMISVIRRARLVVSNDSGPMHVAAGLGRNVIGLFLRNQPGINPKRWEPLGLYSYILTNKLSESIILDQKGKVSGGKIDSISVEDVLSLTAQIFKKNNQYEIF